MATEGEEEKRRRLNFDTGGPPPDLKPEALAFLLEWRGLSPAPGAPLDDAVFQTAKDQVISAWLELKRGAHTYACIQGMAFLKSRVREHPGYPAFLEATKAHPEGLIADVGAALGQDTRSLLLDGLAPERLVVGDVTPVYWEAGISIFGAGVQPLEGVRLLWGDWAAPLAASEKDEGEQAPRELPAGDVAADLQGRLAGVNLSAVLHVLTRTQSACILERLARCLLPGGVLLGSCAGSTEACEWAATPDGKGIRWLHSHESLREALKAAGFNGSITVQDRPMPMDGSTMGKPLWRDNMPAHAGEKRYILFSAVR